MPQPSERRASPRCDVVPNRSRVAFVSDIGTQRIAARLVNISREGALIEAENPPVPLARIVVRIENPVKTDWVDAIVVRVQGPHWVGVRFTQSCPDDLILAGTIGIDFGFMVRGVINGSTACD